MGRVLGRPLLLARQPRRAGFEPESVSLPGETSRAAQELSLPQEP